jgi:probable blue pigment (indigoidine) exporter
MNVKIRGGHGWAAVVTALAPISWGTTYVTVTQLLPDSRPLLVATLRVLPAGLVLTAVGAVRVRRGTWRARAEPDPRPDLPSAGRGSERSLLRTAVLAVLNFGLFFPLLAVAVYRLPGGVAAAAGGLQPLVVAGLSRVVSHRTPTRAEVAVGAAAAIGVGLVVVRPGAGIDPVGVLAAVGANASFAGGVVLTRHWPAPGDRVAAAGRQMLISAALLLPLTVAVEGLPAGLTARNLLGFGYLSLVATGAAFLLWFAGIRRLPVAGPPLIGLAAPLTGAALGWVLLDQGLSVVQLGGFVVTMAAIAYGALGERPPTGARSRRAPAGGSGRPSPDPGGRRPAGPLTWPELSCGPASPRSAPPA